MGVTFSAPFQLNTDADYTKPQWQPNLSVSPAGTLFATWYDGRRESASCTAGQSGTPVLQDVLAQVQRQRRDLVACRHALGCSQPAAARNQTLASSQPMRATTTTARRCSPST